MGEGGGLNHLVGNLLPHAHVQGVKQSVLSVCLSISTKIARSEYLGVIMRYNYYYSVGNVGKRALFGLLGNGHECYKLHVSIGHTF